MSQPPPRTLEQEHAKLFWNNPKNKVLSQLIKLEQPLLQAMAEEKGVALSDDFFQSKVFRIWEIFAEQATEQAPFWRDNYSRINLALPIAKEYMQSVDHELTADEKEVMQLYLADFHERYRKSAEVNDEKFKTGAFAAAASAVGFVAAFSASQNRN